MAEGEGTLAVLWSPTSPPRGSSVPLCLLCAFPSFWVLPFPGGSALHPKAQLGPRNHRMRILGDEAGASVFFKAPQIIPICSQSEGWPVGANLLSGVSDRMCLFSQGCLHFQRRRTREKSLLNVKG